MRRKWITIMRIVRYGVNNFSRNAWLTTAATIVMIITLTIILTTFMARMLFAETLDKGGFPRPRRPRNADADAFAGMGQQRTQQGFRSRLILRPGGFHLCDGAGQRAAVSLYNRLCQCLGPVRHDLTQNLQPSLAS